MNKSKSKDFLLHGSHELTNKALARNSSRDSLDSMKVMGRGSLGSLHKDPFNKA